MSYSAYQTYKPPMRRQKRRKLIKLWWLYKPRVPLAYVTQIGQIFYIGQNG